MQCAVCFKATTMGCSLCHKVFYCNRQHQEKHWLKHKTVCDGRMSKVLISEYNTISEDLRNSRKSPSDTHKFHFSKEKAKKDQSTPISRAKQIQFVERVNKFIENNQDRKDERSKLLVEYTKGKQEQLLQRAKNLMSFSQTIYKHFDSSMCKMLVQKFKTRTSKYIQQLQYLLDTCFLAKLYLKSGARQQLKQLLYSLKLPKIPQKVNILNHNDYHQLQAYKLWKQEVSNCKVVFSLLASIANAGGFSSYSEGIYKSYIHLIERCFGVNEQFLAYFLVGNWYIQIRQFNKAKCCFEYCIELKQSESTEEIIIGDCYYNMAICLRIMNSVDDSIDKMHHALIIRRQKFGKSSLQAAECLQFIGKQLMELKRFSEAIDYIQQCYHIRKTLLRPNQTALVNIQNLTKQLFLIIKQSQKKQSQKMNIVEMEEYQKDIRKIHRQMDLSHNNEHFFQEFGYQTKQTRKLKEIKLDPSWIQELGTYELQSLSEVLKVCHQLSYDEAVLHFLESEFYNSLSQEKKQIFKELNADFRFK